MKHYFIEAVVDVARIAFSILCGSLVNEAVILPALATQIRSFQYPLRIVGQ